MIKRQRTIDICRVLLGILILSAIITEIVALRKQEIFNAANFFSYFTIISNTLAAIFLIEYGLTVTPERKQSDFIQTLRGGITLYMLMVLVIFAVLLAPIKNAQFTAVPWDNIVLHYLTPIAIVADWLIYPAKTAISLKRSLLWLILPFAYVVYSLVRGAIIHWYPYPFLDAGKHGYGQVFVIAAVLFAGVLLGSWLIRKTPVIRFGRRTA